MTFAVRDLSDDTPRTFTRGDYTGRTWTIPQPVCTGCGKIPEDIAEYRSEGRRHGMPPSVFVVHMEGTLNYANGHFLCTPCYSDAGMPSRPHPGRWVAP